MKLGLTWVALVALVGCATGGADEKPSTARVVVTTMTPAAASVVQPSSVIEATVVFTIDKFAPNGNTYYVLIECEDTSGGVVDRRERLADLPILTAPQGSVVLTYSLAKVWANPKLRKPIRVWVDVVERMGPNDAVVIGRSGPVEYPVQ